MTQNAAIDDRVDNVEELSRYPDIIHRLVHSFAPSLYGLELVKLALLYQLVGGVPKSTDGQKTRGEIHVLIIGDPGTGKSHLIQYVNRLVEHSTWLTGTDVKVEALQETIRQGRTAPPSAMEAAGKAKRGFMFIDRIDKLRGEERAIIEAVLEQGGHPASKNGSPKNRDIGFSVLAAGNPTHGRYHPYRTVFENLSLPVTLFGRFDLVFVLKDDPDVERDMAIAEKILNLNQGNQEEAIPITLLKQYIRLARGINPTLSPDAKHLLRDYYIDIREASQDNPVAVSPRQLTSLIRLAEAHARLHLRDTVEGSDAVAAIRMLSESLEQMGLDFVTDLLDVTLYGGKITVLSSELLKVVEVFAELEKTSPQVRHIDLYDELYKRHGMSRSTVWGLLKALIKDGVIKCTRLGYLKRRE